MNKYFKTLLAASVIVGFSSCLKDKEFEDNKYGLTNVESGKIIELAFADDQTHIDNKAVDFEDADINLSYVTVRLASKEPAAEDITVVLDTTGSSVLLDSVNVANETSYVPFTSDLFTIPAPGFSVTIKKGEREGHLYVNTNAINFDPSSTYGLVFRIKSIDKPGYTISGNFGTFITTIGAKNAYDGFYEITGTMTDANGLYKGDYGDPDAPRQYTLTTTGASTGQFYDVSWDYPDYIIIRITTGGAATTGVSPTITFDPSTNIVTSVKDANTGNAIPFNAANSKFNPSNHSIDLDWTSLGRFHAVEHWKYLGPR